MGRAYLPQNIPTIITARILLQLVMQIKFQVHGAGHFPQKRHLLPSYLIRLAQISDGPFRGLLRMAEHLSSPPVSSGVRVALSLVFLLAIVLSVIRFTDSDYLFSILKIFFYIRFRCFHDNNNQSLQCTNVLTWRVYELYSLPI